MPKNRNHDRANLGEQSDVSQRDVEREDRSMHTGSRSDRAAGAEGIEDTPVERRGRNHMKSDSAERSGRASSSDMARASRRGRQARKRH